jgi:tetratricopeptide (TPR) repeat protein
MSALSRPRPAAGKLCRGNARAWWILALAAAIVSGTGLSGAASVQAAGSDRTIRLTALEMFQLADVALAQGDSAQAARIYRALASNPSAEVRAEARYRLARHLISAHREADAAVLLRAVLDEQPRAVGVRLQLAQLLHDLGEREGALRELRAAQASGLPADVARLVDRFSDALRSARPVGAIIDVALAPDTNINRSTRRDAIGTVIGDFQIDKDSKAVSGTGLSLDGQAFRRFGSHREGHTLLVRISGGADIYRKSRFNQLELTLAAGPDLRFGKNRLDIAAAASQRWYGMKPIVRSAGLSATLTRPLGRRTQVQLAGSAELIDYRFNDLQDGKAFGARVRLERALTASSGVAISIGAARTDANERAYATFERHAGLLAWRDIGRATITAEAERGRLRADERLVLFPEKRADRHSRITLATTFRAAALGGFAPVVRLISERNRSSIAIYDYRRTRTEFGVVRAF